jgi:hypothetical protein
MSYSSMTVLFQSSCLLITVLQLVAATLLMKGRTRGTGIMLGGAVVAMIGQVGLFTVPLYAPNSAATRLLEIYLGVSALILLGTFIFVIGLVLYALYRRGQANRVAELEAILSTIQKS